MIQTTFDRLLDRIFNLQLPDSVTISPYSINNICVTVASQNSDVSLFLARILEPWKLFPVHHLQHCQENWQVVFITHSPTYKLMVKIFDAIPSSDLAVAKRWRGDYDHEVIKGDAGKIIVLHRNPFKGITACKPLDKQIVCIFDGALDVSHCEHVVKYPCRVAGRKYHTWDCHASCVSRAGLATLILGPRRAGKTTTSLNLVSLGARYIANDLCAIDVSNEMAFLVRPIPHMLRITSENLDAWPVLAQNTIEGNMGNRDYSRGIVYEGGKYELYDPLASGFIGPVSDGSSMRIENVVFAAGNTQEMEPIITRLSPRATALRLSDSLCNDRPLPDWLSENEGNFEVLKQMVENNVSIANIHSFTFEFHFGHQLAFQLLSATLWPSNCPVTAKKPVN